MTERDDFLNHKHPDIDLRRKAWHQASLQLDRECWIGILQKCSNAIGGWRDCPRRQCRRQLGCIHPSLICHEIARRKHAPRELSPEQEVEIKARLMQQLTTATAERSARGEVDDRPARLLRLAGQKLAAMKP